MSAIAQIQIHQLWFQYSDVDTPNTTSSINYKIRWKSSAGYPVYINGDNTTTYLTIMEELG